MNAQTKVEAAGLSKLREPFAANHISKLPKPTKKQTDEVKADFKKGIRCAQCGSWHHPDVVHLDYVGHAALTDRLLDTDPEWNWEPMGLNPDGTPALDRNGGLWIKLTVCGVTRPGYGCADGKSGGDAMKEIIGDALRNAAMRFGAALDLWHKGGDLHADAEDDGGSASSTSGPPADDKNGNGNHKDDPFPQGPCKNKTELKTKARDLWRDVEAAGDADELDLVIKDASNVKLMDQLKRALPDWWEGRSGGNMPFDGLGSVIAKKQTEFAEAQADGGDWRNNPLNGG